MTRDEPPQSFSAGVACGYDVARLFACQGGGGGGVDAASDWPSSAVPGDPIGGLLDSLTSSSEEFLSWKARRRANMGPQITQETLSSRLTADTATPMRLLTAIALSSSS